MTRLRCLLGRHTYDIPGGRWAWIIRKNAHGGKGHKARCIWCGATHYAVQRRRGRGAWPRWLLLRAVAAGLGWAWATIVTACWPGTVKSRAHTLQRQGKIEPQPRGGAYRKDIQRL